IAATCVSNDGKTVGGSYNGCPAVWKEISGWSLLPCPKGSYDGGLVSGITPDGKYAVGRASIELFNEYPCMWDLENMQLVELPGMIVSNPIYKDMIEHGGNPAEWSDKDLNVRLTGISPDANTIVGTVDFAFPEASWEFIYRRDEAKWFPLGMKYENGRLFALNDDIMGASECVLSADGRYVGGLCFTASESSVPFTCPVDSPDRITLHKDGDGFGVWAIGSDAVVYGSTPTGTPVRNWSVKVGNYWYDWKMVLKQIYGIDWMTDVTKDDLGLSGTVTAVSADNLKILASDYAQGYSYIISLPRPLTEICGGVDLLGDYRVSPVNGAEFSMLQSVVIDMGREIEIIGQKDCASLLDADGNVIRKSINLSLQADNGKRAVVIFRNSNLEPGKDYTVVIPAGSICVAGDKNRTNSEIRVHYRGREAGAVKPVSFSPENGASVARINLTTNPVIVTFNAALSVGATPDIRLVQVTDGVEELLYSLTASVSDRQVMIYPLSEQRLAEGTDYRIDFGAGSVTDLSGAGPNEAFSITYHGSYVPEIDPTSNTVFYDDFSAGVAGMMLYEGDHNTPSSEMANMGFNADERPWIPVLDENDMTGNYAAVSHSSYDIPGKSDDWMVTPQLYLPDDKTILTFKSQSYRRNKKDVLKVYVWESEDVVTILTENVINKMRYNGELVYNQQQTPGDKEEVLDGDWTINSVSLSKYAGKYIYIAFVNDNQNQSAVFVDDVLVSREVPAVISIDTEKTVVDADNVVIRGRFVAMKETGLKGYTLTLKDADANVLGTVSSDESLEKGEICSFSFEKPVSLRKGYSDTFYVEFVSGTDVINITHEVKNLLFATTKRVVLEEMTGTGCQFCPEGIVALEYLDDLYGDLVIPVAIHSFQGDKFGGSEHNAYSAFLGMSAAPQASVGRGEPVKPMYFDMTDYTFIAPDGKTWLQKTEEQLGEMSMADVKIADAVIDPDAKKVSVNMSVRFAVNMSDASVNVFGVLMEDDLVGVQTNGLFNTEAPGLGEWGKGGAYAKQSVLWYYDDVVRGTSAMETAGVYSGFNGKGGYVPASVSAGEWYDTVFDFTLPSGIVDFSKTKVCVMLIDANTGEYINADVQDCSTSGVEGVGADDTAVADVYDLFGRIVLRAAKADDLESLGKGIYIHAGKKYVIR
ncbi:MAG: choice-of-anchor J domain-containing protein, partial [Muribaculaceae bacterium]|nr:choice-of-anchor J domain-containing protein [Muribaculaceae bacterium]